MTKRTTLTLALLTVATLWSTSAKADSTCREFTDPAELAQWSVENLDVVGPQGANGGVALFSTTGAQPARVTSPALNYTTLPNQIWYLCHAIYYLSPTYDGELTIRWEYRLQGQNNFNHFIDVNSLVGNIDPGECQLTFDISAFLEEGGIPAGAVIDQIRFTVVDAPNDVTFGLRGFCFADPDYNYRGLHPHDPYEVPWCGEVCTDGNNCQPGQTPECTGDSECSNGQVCVGGRCDTPCEGGNGCGGEGYQCVEGGGYCAPPCESGLDCYQFEVCDRNNPGGAVCVPRDGFPGVPGGGTPGGGTPGTGSGAPGSPCQGDTQCASQRCMAGVCTDGTPPGTGGTPGGGGGGGGGGVNPGAPGSPCQGDTQCASQRCMAGVCGATGPGANPVCETDSNCAGGRVCLYRQCFVPPGTDCQGDTGCGAGQRCLTGRCSGPTSENPRCDVENKCSNGLTCYEGQCLATPGTPCENATSCSFGQRCEAGDTGGSFCGEPTFEAPCEGDNECGAGLFCGEGFCTAPPGAYCTSDAACSGLSCIRGRCEIPRGGPCQGDTQCSGGARCVVGRCTTPLPPGNFCESDNQCAVGSFCIGDLCKRPCIYDSHCIAENRCVGGFCAPPAVCTDPGTTTVTPTDAPATGGDAVCGPLGCVVNGEPTGNRGTTGSTVPTAPACQDDEVCQAGSCTPTPRACVSSNECNPGDTCGGNSTCANTEGACERNEDCAVGDVCNDGWCGRTCFVTQTGLEGARQVIGCVPGQACTDGVCADRCKSNSDCETGYACDAGSCVPSLDKAQDRVRPGHEVDGNAADGTSGGCSVVSSEAPATSGLSFLVLIGLALWAARRRRL